MSTINQSATGLGMNVAEMVSMVLSDFPDAEVGTKELIDLFNEAQNQLSRSYNVPKKWLVSGVLPISKRIGLGEQVASHKGITIIDSSGRHYRIYSMQEVMVAKPTWNTDTTGGYAVLDLSSPSAMADGELYIRPFEDDPTLTFQLAVAVKPLPLVNLEDQPFSVNMNGIRSDGAMPELHVALVHFALFKLFNRLAVKKAGSEEAKLYVSQGQMYYSIFSATMKEAYEYSDQPFIFPRKPRA